MKPHPSRAVQAVIRFYAELNDFLPASLRQTSFPVAFPVHTSIKHLIESLGVPHTEVDLILVNGLSVDFSHIPGPGDQISVYPVFESLDIQSVCRLRPAPLRCPRFILDANLGKLAMYLRMLGFDALYRSDAADKDIAECSTTEQRLILTRDLGLLKRAEVTHGYYVRSTNPRQQITEVVQRFHLAGLAQPFTRCLVCNQFLQFTSKESVRAAVPPRVYAAFDTFQACPQCQRVYWKGSHYERMEKFIQEVTV